VINECVPLITGVHAYLKSINDVWLSHGPGLDLSSSLDCEWAWALTQALKTYWTRGFPFLLSLWERSNPFTSQLVGCRPWPHTVLGWPFCCYFAFVQLWVWVHASPSRVLGLFPTYMWGLSFIWLSWPGPVHIVWISIWSSYLLIWFDFSPKFKKKINFMCSKFRPNLVFIQM